MLNFDMPEQPSMLSAMRVFVSSFLAELCVRYGLNL